MHASCRRQAAGKLVLHICLFLLLLGCTLSWQHSWPAGKDFFTLNPCPQHLHWPLYGVLACPLQVSAGLFSILWLISLLGVRFLFSASMTDVAAMQPLVIEGGFLLHCFLFWARRHCPDGRANISKPVSPCLDSVRHRAWRLGPLWMRFGVLAYLPHVTVANSDFKPPCSRIGEAAHPGPIVDVLVGSSNPSGLRNKEALLFDLPPGIWHLSETQLSSVTLASCKRELQRLGRQVDRRVRVTHGAAAAFRSNSRFAGTWTGVLAMSDWPAASLQVAWPPEHYASGRIQMSQHVVGQLPIVSATVYGYPSGPTYPRAAQLTEELLKPITTELVLGRRGPRIICGDFNHSIDALLQTQVWMRCGWVEAQRLAFDRWNIEVRPTCKGSTVRDYVWLSPEAAAMCTAVSVREVFAEHSTVIAHLSVPDSVAPCMSWPLPGEVPWSQVDLAGFWAGEHRPVSHQHVDSSDWFAEWSRSFEQGIAGHIDTPGGCLPGCCYGRGRRRSPVLRQVPIISIKPARQGEESCSSHFLSQEVNRWYRQLRRLQALCHAIRAGKTTPAALEYRLQLWSAILRAPGFYVDFPTWWLTRPMQLPGSPSHITAGLPHSQVLDNVFLDFRENYRSFESWCVRRRNEVLQSRYASTHRGLMQSLRRPKPDQVDSLTVRRNYTVLAVDCDSQQIHLDAPLDLRGCSTWNVNGVPATVLSSDEALCSLEVSIPPSCDDELEQCQVLASCIDVQREFEVLWSARWCKHSNPAACDWTRICQFARAFLPRAQLQLPGIGYSQWVAALRRYKLRAARGADGFSHLDLLNMPRPRAQELLDFLHAVEQGRQSWPQQLLTGLVMLLDKQNGQSGVNAFRPICIFSVIYRTWASIRARQCLEHLKGLTSCHAFGFLPQRETTELWMLVEASIELACQCGSKRSGFSVDVVKCFNNLPRNPIGEAARLLGIPNCVMVPWEGFLSRATRRFVVRSCVGQPILSNTGYPEGCPLSTVAMVVTGCLYHHYMSHFAPTVQSLTFVDNFIGQALQAGQVAGGLNATSCFCDAMGLELDPVKTYVWSTDAAERHALSALQLPVVDAMLPVNLEDSLHSAGRYAMMPCGSVAGTWSRCLRPLLALQAHWRLNWAVCQVSFGLKHCMGLLVVQFLCRSSHHFAPQLPRPCAFSPEVRVLLLRLSINSRMDCDPGFYQVWAVITTVRRVCLKQPDLLTMWRVFTCRYDGARLHGPFTKFLEVVGPLGWSLQVPPLFADQEGLQHDLLATPLPLLRRLAEMAWLRYVALAHRHRCTMRDLSDIDLDLLGTDRQQMTPLDMARQTALQSGAFVFGHSQAKFDPLQTGICESCGVVDDARHRLCHCPHYSPEREPFRWACERWDALPDCLTHHPLVPANSLWPCTSQRVAWVA